MRLNAGMRWGLFLSLITLEAYTLAFLSKPDLRIPQITVHRNQLPINDSDLIFLTCYRTGHDAPLIFDLQGNLVWAGDGASKTNWHTHAHNFQTLEFKGVEHLSYSRVTIDADGLNIGANIIVNSNYDTVAAFPKSDSIAELDPHEFSIIGNDTKLLQCGRNRHASDWPLGVNGTIGASVVQVVDIATRKVDFEWRSLDLIPLNETCNTYPDLDYHHINSVIEHEGNYILNGYNTCTIYKINGTDGTIIWRLGGKKSDFKMLDGYRLQRMHHIRTRDLLSIKLSTELRETVTAETHLALSIFDNTYNGAGTARPSAESSSAIVVLLDLKAMTGQVVERYPQPQGMYACLFGSVQFLPNGDRFVGWGGQRSFSQHTQDNELVYHAEIGDGADPTWSYRVFKGPWIGRPITKPDLFAYSWTCFWNTTVYISWNGATEVATWNFYGAPSVSGPFHLVVAVAKEGFETRAMAHSFNGFMYADALHKDGTVLGRSEIVQTHVPGPEYAATCSELRCKQSFNWTEANYAETCIKNGHSVSSGKLGQSVLEIDQNYAV